MPSIAPRGPLHAVVSLLDVEASTEIRAAWARLESELGLHGVLVMPHPHFSYQVAGGYDRTGVESTLAGLAEEIAPFEIHTNGIATFEGQWPVVYVVVKKDPALQALHLRVWNACLPHAAAPVSYYRPEAWIPHVTLAHGEERNSVPLSTDQVRSVLDLVNPKEFEWTITVDNLALVWDDGAVQSPVRTFRLRGRRRPHSGGTSPP
jgi:2'-5' RNA ligase